MPYSEPTCARTAILCRIFRAGGGLKTGSRSRIELEAHCHPPRWRRGQTRSFAAVAFAQRQSVSRCLHRKEATTMRTRLCMKPVAFSCAYRRRRGGSRFARTPRRKMRFVVVPCCGIVRRPERPFHRVREMVDDHLVEIAPDQLGRPFFAVLQSCSRAWRMPMVRSGVEGEARGAGDGGEIPLGTVGIQHSVSMFRGGTKSSNSGHAQIPFRPAMHLSLGHSEPCC